MATVHSYERFSSGKQADGTSIQRQMEACHEFVRDGKHTLSELRFKDYGNSGWAQDKSGKLTGSKKLTGKAQEGLRDFLDCIEAGKVKAGDILFVEAIDRLSRQPIRRTQTLINLIFEAGVDVAICRPSRKVYKASESNSLSDALEIAAFAYTAHLESEHKSNTIRKERRFKRERLETTGQMMKHYRPAWVNPDNSLNEERAEAVRFIYEKTIEGFGLNQVTEMLNKGEHPPMGRTKQWNRNYVQKILSERTVLGEFTPRKTGENGERVQAMPMIPNYYPPVIDEDTWNAARAARAGRYLERGPSSEFVNLFTGILHFLPDNCPAHIKSRAAERRIMSYKARENVKGACRVTVSLERLEKTVLTYLHELDSEDVLTAPQTEHGKALQAVRGKLVERRSRLSELQDALTGGQAVSQVLAAISKIEAEIETLTTEEREIAARAAYNPAEALAECQRAIPLSKTNEGRQRLREALKRLVSQINIAPHKLGTLKNSPVACTIEICFRDGLRRLIACCSTSDLAFMSADDCTQYPALHERDDLKEWLKSNAADLRRIFKA